MKRILGLLLVSLSLTACAQHHGHRSHNYHHYHSHRHDWVVPAAIGGLIVYGISRQQAPQPVVVEQYPYPYMHPNCTEWREIYRNGVRYLERTCFNR